MGVTTAIPSILKELYSSEDIAYETLEDNPLLGVIEKDEEGSGNEFDNFLVYGTSATGAGQFSTAQTNGGAPPTNGFKIPWAQQYVIVQISNKLIKQSDKDEGAFTRTLKLMVDGALKEGAYALCQQLVGDGTGARGTVSAVNGTALATGVVGLSDTEQVVNFQQNMWVQFAYVSGSTWALRNSGQNYQITGLDETNGILSFGASTNLSSAGVVATDIIIRAGDLASGAAYNNNCGTTGNGYAFAGLGGWFPIVRPAPGTGDSFGGVDRSGSTSRLAGVYFQGKNLTPIEAANKLVSRVERQGGRPDYLVCNHFNYERFATSISGQARYETVEAFDNADITYDLLTVKIGGRDVKLVKDRTLSSKVAYALTLDSLCLRSMGPANAVMEYDMYGKAVLPIATADGIEVRVGGFPLLSCKAPAWNGVLQLQ